MKTLFRIIIILAVSLVVVWATNALGQNSSANQEFPPRFEQEGGENANSSDQQARPPRRFDGERGERGAEGFSLRGLASFGQTLIPMTIIIALVTTISNFINRRKRAQKLQAST